MRNQTSRIAIAVAMAAGLAASFASPSFADVNVTASIDKIKTIDIDENITIDKDVNIDVTAVLNGNGAAEAQALANVTNEGNSITLENATYEASLGDGEGGGGINGNTGITQVNQAAGNAQNQGNLVAFAATGNNEAFTDSQAEVDQFNGEGSINLQNTDITASISQSLNGNTGVTQFNQDAGNSNNQTNAVSIAAGVDTDGEDVVVALSEAALGQENIFNSVTEGSGDPRLGTQDAASATNKTASIDASMVGNIGGIIGVNQAAGNNANQANLVSVSAFVNFGGAQ